MPVVIIMDEDGKNFALREAGKFRDKLAARISAISVEAFTYTFRNGEFTGAGRKNILLADGKDCFKKVYWHGQDFVQVPNQGKRQMTIRYRADGKDKSVSVDIDTPKTEEFWKLGVMLDGHLRLNIFVGGEKQYASAEGVALSLR
jgi:hypothetical protein